MLLTFCANKPTDDEARIQLATAQYHTNELHAAIRNLESVKSNAKGQTPNLTLLLAQCYHDNNAFSKAIELYKEVLRTTDEDFTQRGSVADEIKRCAVGLRHSIPTDEVFVENMGSDVNSRFDDFIPVESPNLESRVYFSSVRSVRVSDEFDSSGKLTAMNRQQDCDMFATEIVNGAWSTAVPLNVRLNTPAHEVLQDFNSDGMVAFFTKSGVLAEGPMYVDTFDLEDFESTGIMWNNAPLNDAESVRGLYFFADSILLFASNRAGGFGGFDIYCTTRQAGQWIPPVNLGPSINSQFDEISPFLARDGRTLYYSSNDLTSMGGFDVFFNRFDERSEDWGPQNNLGQPINSAGNDLYFRLSRNGLSSYLSSDRKTGKGGLDIYSAYYKAPRQEQLARSVPPIFFQVRDYSLFSETLVDQESVPGIEIENESNLSKNVKIPVIFFRENDQVITPQNGPKLEMLVRFLKTYPHMTLEILCHSDTEPVTGFDLFFSLKRGEQVADYLSTRGISPLRISIKGLGGNYPLAKNTIDGRPNEAGLWYNRRVDFIIHGQHQLPVQIEYDFPEINPALLSESYPMFLNLRKGLAYSVLFVELDQMFKGNLATLGQHTSIEKKQTAEGYLYFSGLFKSFEEALQYLGEIKEQGFGNAEIIPFLEGIRLEKGSLNPSLFEQYPDLKNYVLYLK